MNSLFKVIAGSLGALVAIPVLAGVTTPPAAPVEVVTDDYYGTRVDDPYRWMESGKDPRWLPWLTAQNEFTRATLDALPGRAAMLADASRLSGEVAEVRGATQIGQMLIYSKRLPGAEDRVIFVRTGQGKSRVLFDVAKFGQGKLALDWMRHAPNGRISAAGLSIRGTENPSIYLIDVASGKVTDTGITQSEFTSWRPDSRGFTYLRKIGTPGKPDYYVNAQPRYHDVVSGKDVLLVPRDKPPVEMTEQQLPDVSFASQGPGAVLSVRDGRQQYALYSADAAAVIDGKANWQRVAGFDDLIVNHSAWADHLWLLSRKADGNGRILLTSVASPDLARARVIELPGNPVINFIAATDRDSLIAETVGEGGQTALWRVSASGVVHRIALPMVGTAYVNNAVDGQSATIGMMGWFSPVNLYRLDRTNRLVDLGLSEKPAFDPSRYEARVLYATARDGTRVPYTVIARKGIRFDGSNPTLLEAYGSYGIVYSPIYNSTLIPFLDRGGVYVVAAVRGGGEFGDAWYQAGRATNKANTWRDAIDVAETLIKTGLTSKQHLALIGTSAGGVMLGGAVNERPDLFAAAIANAAFMNPIRYVAEQNFTDIEEWGGPIADAASFKTMFDLDPYNHIRPGTPYPAMLVVSGFNDPRAATFHGAKYAARMAAATSSGQPVLLRVDFDAGHGFNSGRSQLDATWTDIYSFVLWKTGAPGFQP